MASIIDFALHLPTDRVAAKRGRTAAARPDEDSLTMAAQAAGPLLVGREAPGTLIFVSTTPPYEEGGSAQVLAEFLGLAGDTLVLELAATDRDGLAALRLADSLVAAHGRPVLICAAQDHRDKGGDAAAAVLVGRDSGLADLTPAATRVEEIRERWRIRGDAETHEADGSFVEAIATVRLVESLLGPESPHPVLCCGAHAKGAREIERRYGGPGDSVIAATGYLGAVHPFFRLAIDAPACSTVVSVAAGMAEAVTVDWHPAAEERRAAAAALLDQGSPRERRLEQTFPPDYHPYSSRPLSWRRRGADFRLEEVLPEGSQAPVRELPVGDVVTYTVDRVFPAGAPTGMVALDIDGGGRFFGQIAAGEELGVGDRARLVPRRLHAGGGVIQYFWKAESWA